MFPAVTTYLSGQATVFAEDLRSACGTFVGMSPEVVPTLSVNLACEPNEIFDFLHVIDLLAEEYELQRDVHLSEKSITVRLKRIDATGPSAEQATI